MNKSDAAKRRWADPEYRAKQRASTLSESVRKLWQDPSYRDRQVESHRQSWVDSQTRARLLQAGQSPAVQRKRRKSLKALWNDPAVSARLLKALRSPIRRSKIAKASEQSWRDPKSRYRQMLAKSKVNRHRPTASELKTKRILRRLNIKYRFQVLLVGLIVDFYLPEYNAILEVDQYLSDSKRKYTKIWELAGYTVIRISNRDVSNHPDIAVKIIRIGQWKSKAKLRLLQMRKVVL